MSIYHAIALPLVLLTLTACENLQPKQPDPKVTTAFEVLKKVDRRTKVEGGIKMQDFISLVAEFNLAVQQIPADTNPEVVELLQGSADAYNMAVNYWRCDQGTSSNTIKYKCKDAELEKITAKFPLLKRNIEHRLAAQKTPPKHTSSLINGNQMFSLLVLQAEVNGIDAQALLTQTITNSH